MDRLMVYYLFRYKLANGLQSNINFLESWICAGRAVSSIVAKGGSTCALFTDGNVACWGQNANGQLGVGSTTDLGSAPGQMGANLQLVNLGTGAGALWKLRSCGV